MSIHVLPPEVASRIAAGEVVERPASVVKELIENALDAGATQISVAANKGGIQLIRVSDNGCGIASAEAELAFQRHSTSKITDVSDLDGITTLGFRGEALPSITSVACVTMVTRAVGEPHGTRLYLVEGHLQDKSAEGRAPGTTVTVEDLFAAVPARRKFLKTPVSEGGRIYITVARCALAFPTVRFDLRLDGRLSLSSPGNGNARDAMAAVYGIEVAGAMLALQLADSGDAGLPKVSGFISPPSLSRASRSQISFFVNRRWVSNRMLMMALEDAYRGLLQEQRHPLAVVYLDVPPAQVDANVHPAKTEVRFHREGEVFAAVQRQVRRTLVETSPVPVARLASKPPAAPAISAGPVEQATSPLLWSTEAQSRTQMAPSNPSATAARVIPALRVVGQVGATYIVAEGPSGMYLIDQHAAHERILFEQLLSKAQARQPNAQPLLEPLPVELDPEQQEALGSQGELISEIGFQVESFGPQSCLVRAVPASLGKRDPKAALLETLNATIGRGDGPSLDAACAVIACHSAVRAGDVLEHQQMAALVRQLESAGNPQTCPHGRPTLVHLSASHLEREFGRR